MIRIVCLVFLVAAVSCQDHHYLKIAEKHAIPHHIRHAYDYPQINIQMPQRPAAPVQPAQPNGFRGGFSQPDPTSFMRQSDFMRQPEISSFGRQQGGRPVSQPVRQTRFFNLYTPGSGRDFSLERRQS